MSAYAEFLVQKAITAPRCGLETVPALTPALYPFQADIVSWALKRGRAAIFADCGTMNHESRHTKVCRVRHGVFSLAMPVDQGARSLLLESLSRKIETSRFPLVLRNVRRGVLPSIWRTGQFRTAILLTLMLLRVACGNARTGHLRQGRPQASTSLSRGSRSQACSSQARGRPSHQRRQAKQSSVESRSIPNAGASRALACGGNAR